MDRGPVHDATIAIRKPSRWATNRWRATSRTRPRRSGRRSSTCSTATALAGPLRILDLGCGTGEITRRLARRYPEAQALGVDILEATWNSRDA